jgi:hypothetical protein
MRRSPQWETTEIRQSKACTKLVDLSDAKQTAQCGSHLEIDQLGGCKVLISHASPGHLSPRPVINEDGDQNTGVSDYHDLHE